MQVLKVFKGNSTTKNIMNNVLAGMTKTAPPTHEFKGLLCMNSFTLEAKRKGTHFTPYSTFTIVDKDANPAIGDEVLGLIENASGKIKLLHYPLIPIKQLHKLVIDYLTLLQNSESAQVERKFVINNMLWTKVS